VTTVTTVTPKFPARGEIFFRSPPRWFLVAGPPFQRFSLSAFQLFPKVSLVLWSFGLYFTISDFSISVFLPWYGLGTPNGTVKILNVCRPWDGGTPHLAPQPGERNFQPAGAPLSPLLAGTPYACLRIDLRMETS